MISQSSNPLFQPLKLKNLTLKNRVVMAPMTRGFTQDRVLGDASAQYYRRRAENGVGLILSEGSVIDRPTSANDPNVPRFHGEDALAAWKHVIDNVHAAGGLMGPQLWHVGSMQGPMEGSPPPEVMEGPSGLMGVDMPVGRAMSDEDIADTIAAFARGAGDAKRLGFDVLELHGGHGYLFDQFFWAATNQREDKYGGKTVRERTLFAQETLRAIRAEVGPDFPIFFRLSQFKQVDFTAKVAANPQELAEWLEPLVEAGVDVFDCSTRRFWEPEFPEVDGPDGLNLAGWAKKLTGAISMSVGSVGLSGDAIGAFMGESSEPTSIDKLITRLDKGEFDLIAVGRAILNDPEWLRKIHAGETDGLKRFTPDALTELY